MMVYIAPMLSVLSDDTVHTELPAKAHGDTEAQSALPWIFVQTKL